MEIILTKIGKGIVVFNSGRKYVCSFIIEQYNDGIIIANININHTKNLQISLFDDVEKLSGNCNGEFITSIGSIRTIRGILDKYNNKFQKYDFIISLSQVEINTHRSYTNTSRDIYYLCNLTFPFLNDSSKVSFEVGSKKFNIVPLDNYTQTAFKLDLFSSIYPTAYLVSDNIDEGKIYNILLIFSALTGTRVNYICHKCICNNTKTVLQNRIVKPYSSLTSIDISSNIELNIILAFLLDNSGNLKSKYITENIILSYLDIKNDNNYMESRAIRLVVWFEQLENKIIESYTKYKNCSFRKKMILVICKFKCREEIPYSKLVLLTKSRNSLIHKGDFFSNTATKNEKSKYSISNSTDEYIFLLQIANILLLRGLNYRGNIKDYRKVFNCEGIFA